MSVDFDQVRELLTAIAQTDIAELTLKSEDFELTVRRGGTTIPTGEMAVSLPAPLPVAPKPATATVPEAPAPPPSDKKWVDVTSPMVGTFYRAPAPGEDPFVEVNDRIQNGQTVCIIEAMKLMNEIEAEVSGQVMEILVENGEPVEYGQTLMRVNPS